jgi:hypothetical protein
VSTPQKVTGYGAVGVTWEHGAVVPDDEIAIQVRTRDESGWSAWLDMEYHDDHGPDPDSAEAEKARPGTDELLVGEVDDVQVKITSDAAAPPDVKLAVIDPGVATESRRELPAIDTAPAEDTAPADDETGTAAPAVGTTPDGELLLADEISPDTCRFWDAETGEKLDKDLFRHDLGDATAGYTKLLGRLEDRSEVHA